MTRFAARRRAAPAVAALVLAAMAGSSGGGPGTSTGSSDPAVAIERIGAGLASATVDITMEPGADEEGLRWESEMSPLTPVYVDVMDSDDPPLGFSRSIDLSGGDHPGGAGGGVPAAPRPVATTRRSC